MVPAKKQAIGDAIYEKAHSSYGFLTVAINAKTLTITFWPTDGTTSKSFDAVSVDVAGRKLV